MERQIVLKSDFKAALEKPGVHKGQILMDRRQLVDSAVSWIEQERRTT